MESIGLAIVVGLMMLLYGIIYDLKSHQIELLEKKIEELIKKWKYFHENVLKRSKKSYNIYVGVNKIALTIFSKRIKG